MQLTFITPGTVQGVEPYREPLYYLLSNVPTFPIENFSEWIEGYAPAITLIYYGDLLVGAFTLHEYKRTAELHGMYSPRFHQRVTPVERRAIKQEIHERIISTALKRKPKLITKIPTSNKPAIVWALSYGFERLESRGKPVLDDGRYVFRLLRKQDEQQEKA